MQGLPKRGQARSVKILESEGAGVQKNERERVYVVSVLYLLFGVYTHYMFHDWLITILHVVILMGSSLLAALVVLTLDLTDYLDSLIGTTMVLGSLLVIRFHIAGDLLFGKK